MPTKPKSKPKAAQSPAEPSQQPPAAQETQQPRPPRVVLHAPEVVQLSTLRPHPENYKTHPEDQKRHVRHSLEEFGQFKNVVIARDGTVLAGHGVVESACEAGATEVLAVRLDIDPMSPAAFKVMAADNELARLSQVDEWKLTEILLKVRSEDQDQGLLGTGFDDATLAALLSEAGEDDEKGKEDGGLYTSKVASPVYTPKAENPPEVGSLVDRSRTELLLREIEAAEGVPPEVKDFLRHAAQRHAVFNYGQVAEFYAHAPAEVQRLMENSALVIVDFEKAIERGFVTLSNTIAGLYPSGEE